MIYSFIAGAVLYTILALTSYSSLGKTSQWAWVIAALAGAIANIIWLSIARSVPDSSKLTIIGLYWDLMLTGLYVAVPILLFGARFSWSQGLGMILLVAGLTLIKL